MLNRETGEQKIKQETESTLYKETKNKKQLHLNGKRNVTRNQIVI